MEADRIVGADYVPSIEDRNFYAAHGWWASPVIFSQEEINTAVEGVAAQYAGERDRALPLQIKRFSTGPLSLSTSCVSMTM